MLAASTAAPATATAQPTLDSEATDAAAMRFVQAIERRDDDEIGAALRAPVKLAKLRFDDPACQRQFGGKRVAKKSQVARLATCLPVLTGIAGVRVVHRGEPALMLENEEVTLVVQYRGRFGIVELEAKYDDDRDDDTTGLTAPPIVPASTIEALRITGTRRITPSATTQALIKQSVVMFRYRYCIDTSGRVSTVTPMRPSGAPAYDLEMTRVMRTWRFKPHKIKGKPAFVCAEDAQMFRSRPTPTPTPTPTP
jgi:TonB family protein